jgi:hypothetical protein
MQSAGKQIESFGWTLTKIGCSGFVLVVGVIVAIAALSSGGSSSSPTSTMPAAESTPKPIGTPTTHEGEAPTLNRRSTVSEAGCNEPELAVGPNTSCAFAEHVRASFEGRYEASHFLPATVRAYSPATNREYTLKCAVILGGLVECTTGDAVVTFPKPRPSPSEGVPLKSTLEKVALEESRVAGYEATDRLEKVRTTGEWAIAEATSVPPRGILFRKTGGGWAVEAAGTSLGSPREHLGPAAEQLVRGGW